MVPLRLAYNISIYTNQSLEMPSRIETVEET